MSRLGPQSAMQYNRGSVERALTHHLGEGGPRGWTSDGNGGYTVIIKGAVVRLRTLREAAILVYGMAEKESRLNRDIQ